MLHTQAGTASTTPIVPPPSMAFMYYSGHASMTAAVPHLASPDNRRYLDLVVAEFNRGHRKEDCLDGQQVLCTIRSLRNKHQWSQQEQTQAQKLQEAFHRAYTRLAQEQQRQQAPQQA